MNNKTFTEKYYIDRRKNDSVKWQRARKTKSLPMWIADMDFKCDERVTEALHAFIEQGDYGYWNLPEDYYKVYSDWHERRNGVAYKQEWFRFSRGAIDAIHQVVNALSEEGDGIMICTPLYPPFASTIRRSKRKIYESKMVDNDGYFTFDYKDIEKRFKTSKVRIFMLCSPHNPLGRVFKKGELEELFELCHRYKVLICADEVHCDLIMPDQKFIPALSFRKYQNEIVTISAVAKTFSLALFSHCHIIIPNVRLRKKLIAYQQKNNIGSVNVFSALPTYYSCMYGDEWLDHLNNVIYENYEYIRDELSRYFEMTSLEGSYLLFVNIGQYNKADSAARYLEEECKLLVNAGETFADGYENWVRINLATSLDNIKKAVRALKKITER
ncbi:MAG: aminotransferase class I/II-fold pyridoxal phosphate-dependent enzyme [Erysipelotrichaceae bacterium]|jgi:cystathionine beta-lyase|nr:aminotransferase class I/II-fold pyridoxal phosphate-dependent enzyme [Erysipelotrichaceae bacterium]